MSEATQFETDEFLKLLTDALRAGPGSPQWHEAVASLRQVNPAEADEYRLLVTAREHLESGREYRSVRAGPGFTKKVMEGVERAATKQRSGIPAAGIIAILGALGILVVAAVVAFIVYKGSGQAGTLADLMAVDFSKTTVGGDFAQEIGADWRKFGLEPVISAREKALRGGLPKDNGREHQGGGVYLANPLAAEQAFAIDAMVHMAKPTGQVDLQFFVTQDASFANPKAATQRELVVDLREGQVSVFKPDASLAGEQTKAPPGKESIAISVKMDRRFVIVECEGKQLYAGEHGLAADKPRWPGVRFLTRGPEKGLEDVTVQMMRIMKP